jgi:hypothetical protein
MFSNKVNRPKVANFKVYALILMLMPVALLIKIQPVHAIPSTFGRTCINIQVKLINVSQPEDGVELTADCERGPKSFIPTQMELTGIGVTPDGFLTIPASPVDTASSFQLKCIDYKVIKLSPGSRTQLQAMCRRGSSPVADFLVQAPLPDIANYFGNLVYYR